MTTPIALSTTNSDDSRRFADSVRCRLRGLFGVFMLSMTMLLLLFSSRSNAADAIVGEQWCDRIVHRIYFEGNKVTRPEVMRRELLQKPGEACSLDNIIDGIQNNLDLGLFRSVRAELRLVDAELALVYIVKEKIFFLPIPRFSRTSDGELRLGAQLRWDNFLGRLHQVRLTSEKRQEDDGQGRSGYVHSLDYVVPRFFGSKFGLGVNLRSIRRNSELSQDGTVYGEALRKSQRAEWRVSRWDNNAEGVHGLSYFAGAGIERRDYEMRTGEIGPFSSGQNVSLIAGFEVQRVHQSTFRRSGHQYGVRLRVADEAFGGDFSYGQLDAYFRWYKPLRKPQTNINVQYRMGFSSHAPFGERSYSIGGGQLLRGMKPGSLTGDVATVANIEYLSGLFSYPAWRWVVFADIGNVYLKDKVNLLKQRVRGGVGVRWKLEELTSTDIRIDIAWDPSRQKLTPYLSTSLTF